MNKNFVMLNFCSEYSSQGNTNKRMSQDACFSTIFYSERNGVVQKNKYTLKLYKLGKLLNRDKQNNACLVDRVGIVHHLKILQSVFKFGYNLKEKEDHFVLKLALEGDLIYHKYLLTWVRYLYEYPFNVFLTDAIKIKKVPGFKFESIINLFNLVGASSGIYQHGVDIHAIGSTHKFKELLTTKQIQEKLKKLEGGNTRINDIFVYLEDKYKDIKEEDLKRLNNDGKLSCSEYWLSEEFFKERLPIYQENYKYIKNKKK